MTDTPNGTLCECGHAYGKHYLLQSWPACSQCAQCRKFKEAKKLEEEPSK